MRQNTRKTRQDGFILIVVLIAMTALSALLFAFHRTTHTKLANAHSFHRTEQAWNCARSGLNVAIAAIRSGDNPPRDSRLVKLTAGEAAIPVADGACSIRLVEEDGFLNVNSLKRATGELDRTRIDQFLRLIDLVNRRDGDVPRIGYGIVPAIIDWTDNDNDVTHLPFVKYENLGAEQEYYRSLDPPVRCRNRPIDSLDELLSVKGMTPQVLARLRDSLTAFGDGKININAAPAMVLQSLCEQMSPALVQMIENRRRTRPFANIAELKDVPGMTDNVYRAIKETISVGGQDRYYRVQCRGTVEDLTVTAEAVLRRNTQAGNVDIIQYREL
jgi:general secretion pathway protein K